MSRVFLAAPPTNPLHGTQTIQVINFHEKQLTAAERREKRGRNGIWKLLRYIFRLSEKKRKVSSSQKLYFSVFELLPLLLEIDLKSENVKERDEWGGASISTEKEKKLEEENHYSREFQVLLIVFSCFFSALCFYYEKFLGFSKNLLFLRLYVDELLRSKMDSHTPFACQHNYSRHCS